MKRSVPAVLVLLTAAILLWGCGGGGYSQSGSTNVTVSAGSVASTAGAGPRSATIPSEVTSLRLTVSSTATPADMTPIVSTLSVTPGETTYQLSVTVPNGTRNFLLEALDNTSTLRYRGDGTMNLAGGTASLTIQMYSDVTPPTILSVSPVSGATGVALSSPVTATFSEAMDATTVTGATFTVTAGGTPVPGTVGYSGATATFTPTGALNSSTSYAATVTRGAKDPAGNAIASDYAWSFTTGTSLNSSPEFSIATSPGREMSIGAASDGTNFLVGIQGDQNASNNITAQLVSASTGSLVGSRISLGRGGGAPSVAFDGTNYMMVWSDDALYPDDILYGQRINISGQLVGSAFQIDNSRWQDGGRILFDGSNYFVAYEVRDSSLQGDTADIYGRFISPSGALLGSAIPVSTAPHGQRSPAISFDGTNILVAWTDGRNQSACYTDNGTHCFESDVYGQLITKSTAGAAGVLSGGNFLINASSLPRDGYSASMAFDGTNYFVVFPEETTLPNACPTGGCKWDIYGQFVTKAGVPTGSRITISNTAPSHHFAAPVWNGARYLVTWTENIGNPATSVKGRYFDTSGAPVGSEQILFSAASDGTIPWMAIPFVNGSNYFTIVDRGIPGSDPFNFDAYTNANVYGKFISPSNNTVTFSQADLTGDWDGIFFHAGNSPHWQLVATTINGSGGLTVTSDLDSAGAAPLPAPGSIIWTISAAGVVSEGGSGGDASFHGQMSSNKQLVIGTDGTGGSATLRVSRKRTGTVFSSADFANKTYTYHGLNSGTDNTWEYGAGTTDGSGLLTTTSNVKPSGPTSSVPPGTASLSSAGIMTLSLDNTTYGLMTDDKKVIFVINGGSNNVSFNVITITGQTYTQSDYAGIYDWSVIRNAVTPAGNPIWVYGKSSVDAAGTGTYLSYTDSAGSAAPPDYTRLLSASGVITDPADPTAHGQMSYNKDITVRTNTYTSGRYGIVIGFRQ